MNQNADMHMAGGLDGVDMLRQMHNPPEMANTTFEVFPNPCRFS